MHRATRRAIVSLSVGIVLSSLLSAAGPATTQNTPSVPGQLPQTDDFSAETVGEDVSDLTHWVPLAGGPDAGAVRGSGGNGGDAHLRLRGGAVASRQRYPVANAISVAADVALVEKDADAGLAVSGVGRRPALYELRVTGNGRVAVWRRPSADRDEILERKTLKAFDVTQPHRYELRVVCGGKVTRLEALVDGKRVLRASDETPLPLGDDVRFTLASYRADAAATFDNVTLGEAGEGSTDATE